MKENVMDVLLYLFENYLYDEPDLSPDRHDLADDLAKAGFNGGEISKALDWLDGLVAQRQFQQFRADESAPVRMYAPSEQARLDVECRGFLQSLEDAQVLDANMREMVIERVMAFEEGEMDLDDLKWVVLMVLFNQPGQEAAFACVESMMFDEEEDYLH